MKDFEITSLEHMCQFLQEAADNEDRLADAMKKQGHGLRQVATALSVMAECNRDLNKDKAEKIEGLV